MVSQQQAVAEISHILLEQSQFPCGNLKLARIAGLQEDVLCFPVHRDEQEASSDGLLVHLQSDLMFRRAARFPVHLSNDRVQSVAVGAEDEKGLQRRDVAFEFPEGVLAYDLGIVESQQALALAG